MRTRDADGSWEFVTDASHELLTLLTGITTAVDALDSGAAEIPAERARFVGHLRHQAARLRRLCDSVLALAQADADARVERHVVKLAAVLQSTADGLAVAATVPIDVHVPAALEVVCDPGLLELVVHNVAENAVKYTSSGRVVLCAAKHANGVVVEVRDTGCGMAPSTAAQAFERFFRDGTTGGSGLGLAIAQHAAARIGTTLVIESELGRGTTVRLSIPDVPT
jgi:two-component system phosphate regulon sensor histidine kinase PhoR